MIGAAIALVMVGFAVTILWQERKDTQDREWARKIARRYSEEPLPEPKKNVNSDKKVSSRSARGAYTRVVV